MKLPIKYHDGKRIETIRAAIRASARRYSARTAIIVFQCRKAFIPYGFFVVAQAALSAALATTLIMPSTLMETLAYRASSTKT